MTANKRITDLTDYKSVLPCASDLFGVYQAMLGWRSKRTLRPIEHGAAVGRFKDASDLSARFQGHADLNFNADYQFVGGRVGIGDPASRHIRSANGGVNETRDAALPSLSATPRTPCIALSN
jgi:hypothetical protein